MEIEVSSQVLIETFQLQTTHRPKLQFVTSKGARVRIDLETHVTWLKGIGVTPGLYPEPFVSLFDEQS